jgi:hypothetical protein
MMMMQWFGGRGPGTGEPPKGPAGRNRFTVDPAAPMDRAKSAGFSPTFAGPWSQIRSGYVQRRPSRGGAARFIQDMPFHSLLYSLWGARHSTVPVRLTLFFLLLNTVPCRSAPVGVHEQFSVGNTAISCSCQYDCGLGAPPLNHRPRSHTSALLTWALR